MSRQEAEAELLERGLVDGRFLVRVKERTDDEVVFVVSYTHDRMAYHHLLVKEPNGGTFQVNRKGWWEERWS
jgi:hypothetical protein